MQIMQSIERIFITKNYEDNQKNGPLQENLYFILTAKKGTFYITKFFNIDG